MLWLIAAYTWTHAKDAVPLSERIAPPSGYARVETGEFGEWLRGLPTLPGRPDVLLFDGSKKGNQNAHHLIIDIDVGKKDLQQCADAVIRLRAEYLLEHKREVAFHYTNGVLKKVKSRADLEDVFMYAGTRSLEKELTPVDEVHVGDVFIIGGSPGHAVLVVDVAEKAGDRVFLLAQSYMPAQQIHVVVNPNDAELSPWYHLADPLKTAEWTFRKQHLRRFAGE